MLNWGSQLFLPSQISLPPGVTADSAQGQAILAVNQELMEASDGSMKGRLLVLSPGVSADSAFGQTIMAANNELTQMQASNGSALLSNGSTDIQILETSSASRNQFGIGRPAHRSNVGQSTRQLVQPDRLRGRRQTACSRDPAKSGPRRRRRAACNGRVSGAAADTGASSTRATVGLPTALLPTCQIQASTEGFTQRVANFLCRRV